MKKAEKQKLFKKIAIASLAVRVKAAMALNFIKKMIMPDLKIDKNIDLPKKVSRRIYPFNEMDIKDSFQVAIKSDEKALSKKQNVYIAIWRFCKANPDKKFTTATVDAGIRVWRIQ